MILPGVSPRQYSGSWDTVDLLLEGRDQIQAVAARRDENLRAARHKPPPGNSRGQFTISTLKYMLPLGHPRTVDAESA